MRQKQWQIADRQQQSWHTASMDDFIVGSRQYGFECRGTVGITEKHIY